jgi:hypothetical protein
LDWVEIRGVPDYRDPPATVQSWSEGRTLIWDRPRNQAADRQEVSRVYKDAFDGSDTIGKQGILKRYTSNFPHLAFDAESWLLPLWTEWRARYDKKDRLFLGALARGIRARGWGGMSKARGHAWIVNQAKNYLAQVRADLTLKRAYAVYTESVRSPDADIQVAAADRVRPLLSRIRQHAGYLPTIGQLNRLKLSGVLRLAVSKRFQIRERDLH